MALPPFDPASEPLGSFHPVVRKINSTNFDLAMHSDAKTWLDRFGMWRKTWAAIEIEIEGLLIAGGKIFETEPAGRAAAENGQYFFAESDDPDVSKTLYQRVSESESRWVADDPSAEFVFYALRIAQSAAASALQPRVFSAEFPGDEPQSDAAFVDELGVPLLKFNDDGSISNLIFYDFPNDDSIGVEYVVVDENDNVLSRITNAGLTETASAAELEFPDDTFAANVVYVLLDETDNVLLEMTSAGEPLGPLAGSRAVELTPLIPYLHENGIRATGAVDYAISELGGAQLFAMYPRAANSIYAVIDRPGLSEATRVVGFPGAGLLAPVGEQTLHIVIGAGQSNMVGVGSAGDTSDFSNEYPEDVLMLDTGAISDVKGGLLDADQTLESDSIVGFRPLIPRVQGSQGRTPMESMGASIARFLRDSDDVGVKRLYFTAARGGRPYGDLKRGSLYYTNMLTGVTAAKREAEKLGWHVIVDCVVLRHGETGNEDYIDSLIEWQSDIDQDLKTITGQLSPIPFLMCQPSSHYGTYRNTVDDMATLHSTSPVHHVVGPDYGYLDLFNNDLLHGTSDWFSLNGEYIARAMMQALWTPEQRTRVVRMLDATREGAIVSIKIEVPVSPLVFDSSIPDHDFKGYRYLDSEGDVEITDAQIFDAGANGIGEVRLTLGAAPNGVNERIYYGMSGHLGTRSPENIPRGQLRDSSEDVSQIDGRRLYNWAIHQSINISE